MQDTPVFSSPMPMPEIIPSNPVAAVESGVSGFFSGIMMIVLVVLVILLIAIIAIGRLVGLFKSAPKKETFVVQNSEPNPTCNTDESHAIFPAI